MSNGKAPAQQSLIQLSILTQFYPPDYAATGQLIEELAIELGKLGLPVNIFTGQPSYAFQKQSAPAMDSYENLPVSVHRSRATRVWPDRIRGKAISGVLFCLRSGLHLVRMAWQQAWQASDRRLVLLLTTAPPFLPILGYLANLFLGLAYVCLLYDLYPDIAVELKVIAADSWLVKLWNFFNCCAWKRAQKIIVLSSSMRDRVIAKCPEVADKIEIVHNWADPQRIAPIPKPKNWFAREFNLDNKFTVLYSGNMGRCHDLETILAAAQILPDEQIQFVFIGNGAKRQAFIEQIAQLGLTNCLFLPYQNKENLPYSLTAGDLSLVSISPGMEGLVVPSKLYAALAAGRPIAAICEPHSYLRQLIDDAECGACFSNGDGRELAEFILQLAAHQQLAQRLGRAGRRYLEFNFTPAIIAQRYLEILTQVPLTVVDMPPTFTWNQKQHLTKSSKIYRGS